MGKVLFSQVRVCPWVGGGGYPSPSHNTSIHYPIQSLAGGYPPSWPGWVTTSCQELDVGTPPPPPHGRQSSRASTCYVAGSMPLAFTQEDFIVFKVHSYFHVKQKVLVHNFNKWCCFYLPFTYGITWFRFFFILKFKKNDLMSFLI